MTNTEEATNHKIAFIICPLGEPDSDTRDRSDQILRHIIEPITKPFGFEVIRADKIAESGMITRQVITHLLEDNLVIADLSYYNPNVFYELALRHASRKPFIQIIEKGQKIPFDVSGLRTIELKYGDYDSAEEAKEELKKHIEAILENPSKVESPVTSAIQFERLAQGTSNEKIWADVIQKLENIEQLVKTSQPHTISLPISRAEPFSTSGSVTYTTEGIPVYFMGPPTLTTTTTTPSQRIITEPRREPAQAKKQAKKPTNKK